MPELPEVETVRRVIEPQIRGSIITGVTLNRPEVVARPAADRFVRDITGQTIVSMSRRGKFLCVWLDGGDHIVLHLRMTGCLLVTPAAEPEEKHTHVVFHLSSGNELRFSDPRRFGRFWMLYKGETDTYSGIGKLGLEPFDDMLTADYLRRCLGKRKKSVKECLLDQHVIAGIGNIYADEILFSTKIHPARPVNTLTDAEWERLVAAIPERLTYFVERNIISPEEYLRTRGRDYRNTPYLQVYGHAGEPCPECGAVLCRIVVGGRGSVFCPHCQTESWRSIS